MLDNNDCKSSSLNPEILKMNLEEKKTEQVTGVLQNAFKNQPQKNQIGHNLQALKERKEAIDQKNGQKNHPNNIQFNKLQEANKQQNLGFKKKAAIQKQNEPKKRKVDITLPNTKKSVRDEKQTIQQPKPAKVQAKTLQNHTNQQQKQPVRALEIPCNKNKFNPGTTSQIPKEQPGEPQKGNNFKNKVVKKPTVFIKQN